MRNYMVSIHLYPTGKWNFQCTAVNAVTAKIAAIQAAKEVGYKREQMKEIVCIPPK